MAATRKMSPAAEQQDLDQLKNMFSSTVQQVEQNKQNEQNKPPEEETSLSPDISIQTVAMFPVESTKVKQISDTTVGIRMTKAKKREIKSYFIQKGMTLSEGMLTAFDFLREVEREGRIVFSDGLLKRI